MRLRARDSSSSVDSSSSSSREGLTHPLSLRGAKKPETAEPRAFPLGKANCAGQGCSEREMCRRYRVLIAEKHIEVNGARFPVYAWASFDIEAKAFGSCQSFVRFKPIDKVVPGAAWRN